MAGDPFSENSFIPILFMWIACLALACHSVLDVDENRVMSAEALNASSSSSMGLRYTPWSGIVESSTIMGEGAFGTARLAKLTEACSGDVVVKQLRSCAANGLNSVEREIDMMQALDHPNIVKLYDWYPKDRNRWCTQSAKSLYVYLMMEPAYGGELQTNLASYRNGMKNAFLSWINPNVNERRMVKIKMAVMMLVDALRGLAYMHEKRYVHRDLKMENIWELTDDASCVQGGTCEFAVGDLGLSTSLDEEASAVYDTVGTQIVWPPEVWKTSQWTFRGDVWSLSMALQLLICGYTTDSAPEAKLNGKYGGLDMSATLKSKKYLPEKLKQLLLDMTKSALTDRPTSAEALPRAEEIFKDIFGFDKAHRVRHVPPCVQKCAELNCGECRQSNSTETSCKGLASCILDGTGSDVICSSEEPDHRVKTTHETKRFVKGALGTVVGYLDAGNAMMVLLDGQEDFIRIGKQYLEDE